MIVVNGDIFLTSLSLSDAAAITMYMQDKEFSENIAVIPFPYRIDDAKEFLEDSAILEEEEGIQKNYAIRDAEGLLMGIIAIHFNYGTNADRTEFGYWLGKKHWNKGIMTAVIKKFCELVKEKHKIETLEAYVFDFNASSMKVLVRNGFINTGESLKRQRMDGVKVNAIKYEKVI